MRIAAADALAHLAPSFLDSLSDAELVAFLYDFDLWLRPEQRIPRTDWRTYGTIAGRGWGKSFGAAIEINKRVEAGEAHAIALMAPTEDRVKEVQVDFLIDTSPPWFKAEAYKDGVRWPNGIQAISFTPEAPGRPRSGNFDLSWLCEIVDWQAASRLEAYHNIATATRVGSAQLIWDTTSKGSNEVIQLLLAQHAANPRENLIVRGTTFDNPLLSQKYLREVCGRYIKGTRRYKEEILGEVFAESTGALWDQTWIDDHRVDFAPAKPLMTIVSLDAALSARHDADETGISVACKDRDQYYLLRDRTGHHSPEEWATICVDECVAGAAGVVYERNHLGDTPRDLIKVHAKDRGLRIEIVDRDKPMRPRIPGVIQIKGVVSVRDKETRASPIAALAKQGNLHHVGELAKLEGEMTSWEPGGSKSPNGLDAAAQAVTELAGLSHSKPEAATREAVKAASKMQSQLTASLLSRSRSRRLGI